MGGCVPHLLWWRFGSVLTHLDWPRVHTHHTLVLAHYCCCCCWCCPCWTSVWAPPRRPLYLLSGIAVLIGPRLLPFVWLFVMRGVFFFSVRPKKKKGPNLYSLVSGCAKRQTSHCYLCYTSMCPQHTCPLKLDKKLGRTQRASWIWKQQWLPNISFSFSQKKNILIILGRTSDRLSQYCKWYRTLTVSMHM